MIRFCWALLGALTFVLLTGPASAEPAHGIAMHGAPKYPAGFAHLAYADPAAPRGGTLRLAATGTFDSLNPYTVKGSSAAGTNYMYQTLLARVWDEPFTLYGLLAESVEMPPDRAWVAFTLRPEARWSDGTPVTVDDVEFSLQTIRTQGKPNSRATYKRIDHVERFGERGVRFVFTDNENQELPLLVGGFLPILSKAYWETRDFQSASLDVPVTSGPYRIESLDPGRSIVYARVADWWGDGLGITAGHYNFDRIRFDYYRDQGVAVEAFKAGDYDLRYEFSAARWASAYDFPARDDGRVTATEFRHGIPSGLSGMAFNLRRAKFQDLRVRRALALAFDFEWVNKTLLHGAYTRTASLFDNSAMAPEGPPSVVELKLLEPWRGQIPEEVFGTPYVPPATDGSGNARANLREAAKLLREGGYEVRDGALVDPQGAPFTFEIVLRRQSNEKIALAFARNLEKLGVEAKVRLVDSTQYQALIEEYDFDMAFRRWGVTLSPGNEQQNYWSSTAAQSPGSRNETGVQSAAVDALIAAVLAAEDRDELVAAVRALDRVLMWSQVAVPLYHRAGFNVAYWNRLDLPATISTYGPVLETWWAKE